MGVLFLAPNWQAPSELWLQRMIEALAPHIVAIGAYNPDEPTWRGQIPALALNYSLPRLHRLRRRIAGHLRVPIDASLERKIAQARLRRAVGRAEVSIVFAHYLEFALQFEDVWATTEKPLVVHCHGYDTTWDLRDDQAPYQTHFEPGYVPSVRRLSQRAIIIANSHSCAQRLFAVGIPQERVIVKYLGVPVPDIPRRRVKDTGELHILFLGRLSDCKGPDLVIRAFELACARGLDGYLILAGDGPLRMTCDLLRLHSKYARRITVLGAVDAATGEQLRDRADVFTAHNCLGPLSHQEEALGVSVLEAMAAALPVVSGCSGGLMETVVDGQTGILVEPGDIEAHAEAFLRLSRDAAMRQRMGDAGWQRVREHFSLEKERTALLRILGCDEPLQKSSLISGCH